MTLENVTLDTFAYGGECFGRLAEPQAGTRGRAVFVPYTLPGEKVRIRLVEEKRGFARGELIEILEPSPDRVEPRCPHYFSTLTPSPFAQHTRRGTPEGRGESGSSSGDGLGVRAACGGCHYQHIPYEVQLRAKTEILRDQLRRIGKMDDPPVGAIVPSPNPWNYRNNIQFHLAEDGRLGFQAPRSHDVVPIRECHLPDEVINQVWPRLDMGIIPGLDRLSLRLGAGRDVLLTLESSDPHPVELEVDLPISVVHTGPGGSIVLAGDDHTVIEVKGREFRVSAESFFQVNTRMAETMVDHVLENLELPERATLIDAYCGVGLFSALLAPQVERLIGIEISPSACQDFAVNLDEFENVELYEARVGEVLPVLGLSADILIVDPPRSGLDRRTMDGVLSLGPQRLVYVSCDPATLSRDARRLVKGGYQPQTITPFDLFPQTYHIESISFWARQS